MSTWTSPAGQAEITTVADAECLQAIFDSKLDITMQGGNTVHVECDDEHTDRKVADFLSRHGAKCNAARVH